MRAPFREDGKKRTKGERNCLIHQKLAVPSGAGMETLSIAERRAAATYRCQIWGTAALLGISRR